MPYRVWKFQHAYVLSLNPIVEINRKDGSSRNKATGSLHQSKCRNAYVLSFTPVVEKNSTSKKAVDFLYQQKCRLSQNLIVVASESTNLLQGVLQAGLLLMLDYAISLSPIVEQKAKEGTWMKKNSCQMLYQIWKFQQQYILQPSGSRVRVFSFNTDFQGSIASPCIKVEKAQILKDLML